MNNKIILCLLILSIFLVSACAPVEVPTKETDQEPAKVVVVSETRIIKAIDEEEEIEEVVEVSEEEQIPSEIEEFLSIADEKVQSISYSYKGPETKDFFYDFFVKGNNIKYILSPTYFIDVEGDNYDAIYLDKVLQTAQGYCDAKKCYRKGKKADLDYDEEYILTPLDWLDKIEEAEKVGEEIIDRRDTWKLSTKPSSLGNMTIYHY